MVTFNIQHGVKLKSSGVNLVPFQRFATEKPDEIAELRELGKQFKLCTEVVPEKPKEAPKSEEKTLPPADPKEDITLVKGVGKSTAEKLAEKGITTKGGLKEAMEKDKAMLTELLGELTMAKIEKSFAADDPK